MSSGNLSFRRHWVGDVEVLPTDFTWNGRPLVVIDPASRVQMELLLDAHNKAEQEAGCKGGECGSGSCWIDIMRGTFREFANPTPPKPDEPTKVGSLIVDADDETWVRDVRGNWICLHSGPGRDVRQWAELNERYGPIRVLSVGVVA